MRKTLSRHDFLNVIGASFSALATKPLRDLLPPEDRVDPIGIGRVTISEIGVFREPNLKSERIGSRKRDELVSLFEELISPYGPPLNPRWYRVVGGYCHSAYLQRVEAAHLNTPLEHLSEGRKLGEVTVPYTQSMYLTRQGEWIPLYRLYFGSVHWITGIEEMEDGQIWYRITDELLREDYFAPAIHLRPVMDEELAPISPDVPPHRKWIEVSILKQTLTAFEDGEVVLHTKVSTGLPAYGGYSGEIPTETPRGNFTIDIKMPSKHMGDGQLTSDIHAYELPGVPWVCFFKHPSGVAFHGTYWHNNFGSRMSHGCVNMRNEDAKWLYRWTTPIASAQDWDRKGSGTKVRVF